VSARVTTVKLFHCCLPHQVRATLGGVGTRISGSYQNVSDRRRRGSFHGSQLAGNEARIDRQIAAVGRRPGTDRYAT